MFGPSTKPAVFTQGGLLFIVEHALLHMLTSPSITTQKMKFSIKDFFSKCEQIHKKMQIWSHLLKKLLMKNFIFVQYILKKTTPAS